MSALYHTQYAYKKGNDNFISIITFFNTHTIELGILTMYVHTQCALKLTLPPIIWLLKCDSHSLCAKTNELMRETDAGSRQIAGNFNCNCNCKLAAGAQVQRVNI